MPDDEQQASATHASDTDTRAGEPPKLRDVPPVVTAHTATVGGQQLSYQVTTGLLPLKNAQDEIEAQIFYMAYTLDRPGDDSVRPLTFAFNGGPGSASIWLHLGALGPRRVQLNDDGTMPPPPFRLVDNDETWLPQTDIVFIDPVGTGFSRAAKPELEEKYYSYTGDIESLATFVRLYLTRNGRWTSPLFLAGESYGTLRAAGLAGRLIEMGIALNGIVLVSTVLSYLTLDMHGPRGNDLPFCLFLPSFAATAWYHKRLPADLQALQLTTLLAQVEEWATGTYLLKLVKGDALSDAERQEVIQTVARYTGLDERYVDQSELRPQISRFCKELLRAEKRAAGRLDSRFSGVDLEAASDSPEFDPSLIGPTPPFTATFNDYVRRELGYKTDVEYETLSTRVNEKWKFDSARNGYLETSAELRKAFMRNPHLRVLVAYGYYDLATPYWATIYTMNHLGLEPALRANIDYAAYEAGHMLYIDSGNRRKFHADVVAFLGKALGR